MIKRLKKKFILVAVGSVAVVIIFLSLGMGIFNYYQMIGRADDTIDFIKNNLFELDQIGQNPQGDKDPLPYFKKGSPFRDRYIIAVGGADKRAETFSYDLRRVPEITTGEVTEIVTQILNKKNSNQQNDTIENFRYRLTTSTVSGVTQSTIILLDISRDLAIHRASVYASFWLSAIVISAVFIVVYLLSGRAIAPIVESYQKQQQFITDASHELKTPLAIINTNVDVIELTQGSSEWSSSIHKQIKRMTHLVENLVTLAKIDEHEKLSMEDYNISSLAEHIVQTFEPVAVQNDFTLTSKITADVIHHGNPMAMEQLMSTLLENSIKYTVPSGTISFRLFKREKSIYIEIENEASDLEIKNYNQLFERFYRLDVSHNSESGGHGIGLSIAKAIVDKHHAQIDARSEDGKSFSICITL